MRFTEEQLERYSKPISSTEEQKCKNALRMVSSALEGIGYSENDEGITNISDGTYGYTLRMSYTVPGTYDIRKIKLFVQGSYANNTNIRQESDVDLAVILESTFNTLYRSTQNDSNYNFSDGTYSVKRLKDDVLRALNNKFTYGVKRNDKSIKITGNSYRVDADVVPCIRLRDYTNEYLNDAGNYIGGIRIYPDAGGYVDNYPEQHIINGRKKNVATNHSYKKMVRIIKNMKKLMVECGYESAKKMNSFGLESLLWNIENTEFTRYSSKKYIFEDVVNYLHENRFSFILYKEANGIKDLCGNVTSGDYIKFIEDLKKFYEY